MANMSSFSLLYSFLLVGICICCIQISLLPGCHAGRPNDPAFKLKAVNLGGWLITEGWIKPSLFDGIPNKDLLDGTQVQLKSVTIGKYVCAENGGGTIIVANRTFASEWETFKLWRINENTFNFRVLSNQFIGLQTDEDVPGVVAVANASDLGASETFQIVRKPGDTSRVRIQATNGLFLQAKTEDLVTADYAGDGGWGDDDPSVFVMNVSKTLHGEYQLTNGYGPEKAPKVMKDHWNTFIVEDDFNFISQNGLNGVRIPVGWWIASNPTPKPFVEGSLQALDNAFSWAQKYKLQVMIDLHAAPGSQNTAEHSSTRDESVEWGKTDETIQQAVAVIDFLTARYAKNPYLYAVELINEPLAPDVSLDSLKKYYQLGYDAVRKYSSSAYVVMTNRLLKGASLDPRELFPFASGLQGTVIDVHYYNLFIDMFKNMTVQQNMDYINNNRSSELRYIASTSQNDPLIFVGEWVAEWEVSGATKEDLQSFGNAQLEVYGRASFGWAYWTLKNVKNHWSMKWMIQNGYINLMSNRDHWNTFIVEDDFKFISENGLNAVRIPVGWWIASDPTPKPFVEGSLQALDNAFSWAQKYKIQVIIDLHAAPGSQNGNEHSGTRDGSLEWGKTDETIQQSVTVIDFLTARYAKNPYLYAVELINEPHAPDVSLDTLKKYYQLGYDAVRKYSSTAYVVMSNRLGGPMDPRELFPLASGLQATVIDVHYYNLFSDIFKNMNVQQNIDFINNNRSSDLSYISSTSPNDPLTFVGEWVAEWEVSGATKEDFQKFGNAQLDVYGRASFGWAYWTLKNVKNHWSLMWMIQNGYINLSS